ncbi:MAG: putative DNA binding domain-containing protein [Taibaiella sp.]|nr:putative DNA binding domain-containing protein [Taibaiella sp.]
MNIDLKELSARESEQVEWKENGDDQDVAISITKTISAFANDISNLGGGYVVCGAKETKDEYGFPSLIYTGLSSSKLRAIEGKVLQHCREYIHPAVIPIVSEIQNPHDSSTRILVFTVMATKEVHTYRDKSNNGQASYIRMGKETREAKNGIFLQLMTKKNKAEYFDRKINTAASVTDIELLVFKELLQELGEDITTKPLENYLSDTNQISALIPPLFAKTELDNVLKPKNFTLLVFGKKESITRLFTEAYTIVSIYHGIDRSGPTAERYTVTGNIVWQARRITELLHSQSYTAFDKTSDRPNIEKYPLRAVQEAVVNAIVHRDYEIPEPNRITVFSDRIEINSAGSLPPGVDREKFLAGRANPKWRNQSFAWLFNKLQLAQAEGQGIPTIFKTMETEGYPRPVFEIEPENIICTIPAYPRHVKIREDRLL